MRKGIREIVRIPDDALNVALVGDRAGVTVITGSRAVDDDYLMPETATVGKPCVLCVSVKQERNKGRLFD